MRVEKLTGFTNSFTPYNLQYTRPNLYLSVIILQTIPDMSKNIYQPFNHSRFALHAMQHTCAHHHHVVYILRLGSGRIHVVNIMFQK